MGNAARAVVVNDFKEGARLLEDLLSELLHPLRIVQGNLHPALDHYRLEPFGAHHRA